MHTLFPVSVLLLFGQMADMDRLMPIARPFFGLVEYAYERRDAVLDR